MESEEIICEGEDYIHLVQDKDQWQAFVNSNDPLAST
jgi:hypothetical protein